MSTAATRSALAAASVLALLAVVLVGSAGGASIAKDRIAPTSPGDLHVTDATSSLVRVAWDPSQDDTGVAGYYVYGDSGRARSDITSYILSSLGCGQSSAVSVVAFDRAGNRSPRATTMISTAACPDTQPPSSPSGFRQQATTQNAVILAWDPSVDNVGVVSYGVYQDGVYQDLVKIATSADPSVTLSGLSCGTTYTYGVDATDAAGNKSPLASAFVRTSDCADGQPPTAPTNVAVTAKTTTTLGLSWSGSSDNVGVAGYRVSVNGTPALTVSGTTAQLAGLVCGTSYSLGVDAFDAAGNRSSATGITVGTDPCATPPPPPGPDTTAPSTPSGLAASNVAQTALTLSWNASTDNVGVTSYDVYRNGTKVASASSTSASQSGLTCGTAYAFGVVARDAAGNASSTAQLNVATVACAVPPPPPPPPSDTTAPSQPASFRLAGATSTSISLAWDASTDNVGVAGYRTYRNGAAGATTTQTSATVSGLTCGTAYSFDVDAYDAAGNRSAKSSLIGSTAACADTQAPSAPLNVAAGFRTATSIALSWSASTDNVGVAGYGMYRGGVQVSTSATTTGIFSGLACNTNYTLAVDAYDAAGNRSTKATTMVATTACPDSTPPSTPTGLAASSVSQTGLTLGWNASTDNVGVTGYDVYRNSTRMATVTSASSAQTGLACGTSYSFGVVARDTAGNSSTQASLTAQTSACAAPPPPPPPPPVAADRFAAPNGSDSNPGTLAAPYQTVAKLVSSLSPGQIGMLRGGTYGDSGTYTPLNVSGASGQPITVTNYPGETPTVKGYIEVNGDYITIRGLRIDGSNSVMVNPGKCGTQALGILLQGHDEIFEHNEVFQSGNKGTAIIQHGDRNVIRYNKLHDFGACYAYDHGVYVGDGDSVQIYGNWIWNNSHGWGVQVYPGPTNARIHDNVVDANGGGFVISDDGSATSTGNQIYNNVVMNSVGMTTQSGYYISGAAISGAGPVAGSNNSFTSNDAYNTPIGDVANIALSGNMTTDPGFVDAGGNNYAVSSSSPLASWGLWDGK